MKQTHARKQKPSSTNSKSEEQEDLITEDLITIDVSGIVKEIDSLTIAVKKEKNCGC